MSRDRKLRKRLVGRLRRRLDRFGSPRIQMTLMVLATATAGFLCSYLLLRWGLATMWLRYSASVVVAYAVFLGLIYVWLLVARHSPDIPLDLNPLDSIDLFNSVGGSSKATVPTAIDAPVPKHSGGLGLPFDLDGEAAVVVAVVVITIGVAVIASVYVITQAPTLLAEVLLDGALSVGLYRRLRSLERHHWLESAVSRTQLPFLWVLVFFIITGLVFHSYAPEAVSIGGVWHHLQTGQHHGSNVILSIPPGM